MTDWKLALVQHPMYFLIKEDTICAERTPPWGAPNIEIYIERVRRNLETIKKYPQVKVGFEWSGLELELLANDAPEVFAEMCSVAKAGGIDFYNGTYSQPHLQTLSSEACYRQFEVGTRVYNELCGKPVQTYAHQEASVNDQVPQLMKAFGLKFGVVPRFSSTLAWLDEGELILFAGLGPRFVHGHEFVKWHGLDGTEVPLYLSMDEPHGNRIEEFLAREEVAGRLRVPPILLVIPDLIEVDDEWLEKRKEFDLVLLDDELEKRLKKTPPLARARFFSNWSYIEGIRAEELSRSNWIAEISALRAEALNALAFATTGRPVETTDCTWKTIMSTQHHDVYCFCAPELREKSVRWLQGAASDSIQSADRAAQAIIDEIECGDGPGQPVVVFNTTPHPQTGLVTIDLPVADPIITDPDGNPVAVAAVPDGKGGSKARFLAAMNGMGYSTYRVQEGGQPSVETTGGSGLEFENEYYKASIQDDGTFTSLVVKPSGTELLDSSSIRGNQLAATDSTGLSPNLQPGEPRGEYKRPGRGPDLYWEPTSAPQILNSPLGMVFTVPGLLGPEIEANLVVSFYHLLPRIDLSWTFEFDNHNIGTFYNDDTKLRVHWPLAIQGDIHHDIAFGVIQSPEERPFFPASWVDISNGKDGFAYLHQGTLKHWVSEGALVNLFAWGEHTDAIGSRLWQHNWMKSFDQRLNGRHTIHAAIYPHTGDWRAADVIGVARSFDMAPVAYVTQPHAGSLPTSMDLLKLADPETATTTVKVQNDQIKCRLYSVHESSAEVKMEVNELPTPVLRSLDGQEIPHLKPFQIGTVEFKNEGKQG